MAYVKGGRSGKVREVHKGAWVALAIVVAVAITAAILGGTWAKNPRKFMQWFLSDQDYASYVVLHNIEDNKSTFQPYLNRLTENAAYETEGNMSVELSADVKALIGDEEIEKTVLRYLDRLTFESSTQMRSLHFSNELKLNDKRQTIMTHDFAFLESGGYSFVPEYGYGWTKVMGSDEAAPTEEELLQQRRLSAILSSDDESLRTALTDAAKAGYKEVKEDIDVDIDEDIPFDFQDKHVTGDRVNIQFSRSDVLHFLTTFFDELKAADIYEPANASLDTDDRFASAKEFSAFLGDLRDSYTTQIKDTGVTDLSVDLCVDKQNVIHAFDALVKRADGDVIANAMFQDEEGKGPAFHLRVGGDTVLKFNVEKSSDRSGHIDFAFGNFENTVTYNDLQTADGLVYGTFEFAPTKVNWSEDLGTFGLYLQVLPAGTNGAAAEGAVGSSVFDIRMQTGFSTLGTATINATVKDAKYTGMVTEDEIVIHDEYLPEEKGARRVQYWLVDLPEKDPLYNSALSKVVRTLMNDVIDTVTDTATAAKSEDANATLNPGA